MAVPMPTRFREREEGQGMGSHQGSLYSPCWCLALPLPQAGHPIQTLAEVGPHVAAAEGLELFLALNWCWVGAERSRVSLQRGDGRPQAGAVLQPWGVCPE